MQIVIQSCLCACACCLPSCHLLPCTASRHGTGDDVSGEWAGKWAFTAVYIGWSDVTYLWSQCDRHFVGQHVVLCVVKWWRFVALFEYNWIIWFKKMSVLSLSYLESDVYWRQNNRHFAELAPQNGGKQLIWRNDVTVILCVVTIVKQHICSLGREGECGKLWPRNWCRHSVFSVLHICSSRSKTMSFMPH